jgi:TnpA family transposase
MAVHSQLISCSAYQVHAMVEGAMRHGTDMKTEQNFVDPPTAPGARTSPTRSSHRR